MRCGDEGGFVGDRQAMVYDGRNDFTVSGRMPPHVMGYYVVIMPSNNDDKGISIVFMTMLPKKQIHYSMLALQVMYAQCDSLTLHFHPDSVLNSGKLHRMSVSCF